MECLQDVTDVAVKGVTAAGGFLGGTSMMLYMKPTDMTDGIRRILVSTVSAVMLSTVVSEKMFGNVDSQILMGVAFGTGFVSWSILGAIARFFEGRQNQDIVQMAKSVNEVSQPKPYYPSYHQPLPRQVDNPDE